MIALGLPELGVPYFSELSGAVINEVVARSYTVIIEQTDGDPTRERTARGGCSNLPSCSTGSTS